jgi:hypothetical protein
MFLTPLRIEKVSRSRWILIDSLVYESIRYRGVFIAPRGFQTDLASIPQPLWSIIPKIGDHDMAAVLHDAAYAHALLTRTGERIHCVKHVADNLFAEALCECPIPGLRRWLMVRAVRMYGDPAVHPLALNVPPKENV